MSRSTPGRITWGLCPQTTGVYRIGPMGLVSIWSCPVLFRLCLVLFRHRQLQGPSGRAIQVLVEGANRLDNELLAPLAPLAPLAQPGIC